MEYTIRELLPGEYHILEDFLYHAIFIPEGAEPPPRDIIKRPELELYYKDFGTREGDHCLAAVPDGSGAVVGAVWSRIMDDYGHITDGVPSLAISLYPQYRGYGIGTELMRRMLALLAEKGYSRVSLAVQKANYAVRMYKKTGFSVVGENDVEYIMAADL